MMRRHVRSARLIAYLVLLAESAAAPAQVKTNVPTTVALAAPAGVVLNFAVGEVIVAWNAAQGVLQEHGLWWFVFVVPHNSLIPDRLH